MSLRWPKDRRDFLVGSGVICAGLAIPGVALAGPGLPAEVLEEQKGKKEKGRETEEISPAEDLMREHGLLNRILLIYEEHLRRLDSKEDFNPSVLANAGDIIRRFVEDYHEKLEENYLFPRFRKANKLVDLVVQQLAVSSTLKDAGKRRELSDALTFFIHMYRPHEAREDTVLFPAFRSIVSKNEYDSLGDEFEKKEDELFGEEGFFKVVDQVAGLEKKLGIYDLSKFTPK